MTWRSSWGKERRSWCEVATNSASTCNKVRLLSDVLVSDNCGVDGGVLWCGLLWCVVVLWFGVVCGYAVVWFGVLCGYVVAWCCRVVGRICGCCGKFGGVVSVVAWWYLVDVVCGCV